MITFTAMDIDNKMYILISEYSPRELDYYYK